MKRVASLASVLALLVLAPAAEARAQAIMGAVVEDSSRARIVGASVEVAVPGGRALAAVVTDSAGQFMIPVRVGRLVVRWSHPSYATRDTLLVDLRREDIARLYLPMSRSAIQLQPVVVRTQDRLRGYNQRLEQRTFGRFVTRQQIESRPGARATDLLREVPGVTLVPVQRGMSAATTNLITLRSPRGACMPTIYVDGMVMYQYAESGLDDILRPSFLEGVEVYVGIAGVPPELDARDGCGVVAFWTRGYGEQERFAATRFRNGALATGLVAGLILLIAR